MLMRTRRLKALGSIRSAVPSQLLPTVRISRVTGAAARLTRFFFFFLAASAEAGTIATARAATTAVTERTEILRLMAWKLTATPSPARQNEHVQRRRDQ